jgi:hypothetical protein
MYVVVNPYSPASCSTLECRLTNKFSGDPLCTFLEHKPPAWAFPRVNSTDEFWLNAADVNLMVTRTINARIVKTLVAVTAVSAIGVAWWARYSRGFGSSLW